MEVDHMRSSSFDMRFIWELDIFFLEIDTKFLLDTSSNLMFTESSEDFVSFALE